MKRISLNDLEAAQFPKALKGYDTHAVDEMLKAAAGEISTLQGELKNLRKEYQCDFRELEQFREKQWMLADALVIAQKAAEEILSAAQLEADQAVQQGRSDADRIKGDARDELAEIERTVKARRKEKAEFEARFRRMLDECLRSMRDSAPMYDSPSFLDSPPSSDSPSRDDSLSVPDGVSLLDVRPFSSDGPDAA